MRSMLFFSLIILLFSCTDTNVEESFYPNGMVKERIIKKNSFRFCIEEYYNNGNLKANGCERNGKPIGEARTYYENGQIQTATYFEMGKIAGIRKSYHQNGDFNECKYYIDGDLYYAQIFDNNKVVKEHIVPLVYQREQETSQFLFNINIPFSDTLDYFKSYVDVYYKFSKDSIGWGDDKEEEGVFRFDNTHTNFSIETNIDTSDTQFLKTLSVINGSEILGYLKVERIRSKR